MLLSFLVTSIMMVKEVVVQFKGLATLHNYTNSPILPHSTQCQTKTQHMYSHVSYQHFKLQKPFG